MDEVPDAPHQGEALVRAGTRVYAAPSQGPWARTRGTHHYLVRSVPGKNGGFALAKAPDAISLDAVLEAVGGG